MKYTGRLIAAALIVSLLGLGSARAAPLLNEVQLVTAASVATNPVPPAQTFTISQAGSYTVTLTDLQLPTALSSLSLVIATSSATAVTLSAAGTQTVTLPAGTYTAQVLALATSGSLGGAFSVQVAPAAGGALVWQYEDAVGAPSPAPTTGQSTLSTKFTVSTSGTYQLSLSDLMFPVALGSLQLIILNDCGTTVGCVSAPVAGTPVVAATTSPVSLSLPAGTYDLFVAATADSTTLQGLYSVQIAQGSTIAYAATLPVGELPSPTAITIPANGTVSMLLADLATPAALASIQAIVTEGANVLLQPVSAAGTTTFAATAGTAQLYVVAQPGSTGQGAYEAYFTLGSQVLADIAEPVLASGFYGYEYATTLAAGGSYQVSVYDFQLPTAFSTLTALVAQAGAVLPTTQGSSSFTAVAGPLNVLVFPVFATSSASSSPDGLFSVQVAATGTGTTAFETTQGVGAVFSSTTVTVTTAGNYDLILTDLAFPATFSTLAVIATRGDSLTGQIFGGGSLPIAATPGTYVLNVLADVGTAGNYGLYGLEVAQAAAAPTATLSASSSSVTSGKSVTLTWSSAGATACTASASPASAVWTGTLSGTSGNLSAGALTATTTFSLSCAGAGGTASATAQVTVTPITSSSSGGGGGGALSLETLWILSLALILQLARRRATLPN